MLKFLSVNNIVSPAANTGTESTNKIAVKKIDHTNKGNLYIVIFCALILRIVTIKLIAPRIELAPATCKLSIAKSTEAPLWLSVDDKGG